GIRDKLVTGVQTCALPISADGAEVVLDRVERPEEIRQIADDYAFLAASRAGDLANLFGAFDTVQNYFRPIGRELYFLAVSWFAGADPYRFHLVNLGILLATLGLVVALGARLAGMRAGVLAGGIYALVYPH